MQHIYNKSPEYNPVRNQLNSRHHIRGIETEYQ